MKRVLFFLFSSILLIYASTATPTCNLTNGLILSTYDINGYRRHYPNNHEEFERLESEYAKKERMYGRGVVDRIDTVGRDNNPFEQNPDERYMSIFEGYLYVPKDGSYSFAVNGDDAVEVIIDGKYLGWYGGHGADGTDHHKSFLLGKGYHKLKFRHQEWSVEDNYQLYWKRAWDRSYAIVPKSNLFYCGIPKPVVEYRMDECKWSGRKAEVRDSSGNGYEATAFGEARTTQGVVCRGGEIKRGGYIESQKAPRLSSYTLSAWVKAPNGNYHPIFFKREEMSNWGSSDIEVYIGNGFTVVHNRKNGGKFQYVYVKSPPNNKWFHLAVVYDGGEKRLRVYYDGKLQKEVRNFTPPLDTKKRMFIGRNGGYYLDGDIDELKIFDKALKERDIEQIYNNEKDERNWDGQQRGCLGCTPACPLKNGLILSTYDINGYRRHYPNNHEEFERLESEYAKKERMYGRGVVDRIDTVGRDNNPFEQNPDERYMSIFEGYLYVPKDGSYSFAVNGDDAVEVIIDGKYLGWYGGHGADGTDHHKSFLLGKGYHKLKFRHQEWSVEDNYQLYWKRAWDRSYAIVPKSNLFYCQSSQLSYRFDAWDIFRNLDGAIVDRNISTKIVDKEFALLVASLDENGSGYQEFNGTVCIRIEDENGGVSAWQKRLFWDMNTSAQTSQGTLNFTITRALRRAIVHIAWIKDKDVPCPLKSEGNETNASDQFAVRPEKFVILPTRKKVRAGENFFITFEARSHTKNLVPDYNESKDESFAVEVKESDQRCITGAFTLASFAFGNGIAKNILANYGEVGELNISIHEKDGKEFALVDRDDTNTTQRFIQGARRTVRFIPHHFAIWSSLYDFDREKNFTYLSFDLNMSAKISALITAQNAQDQTTFNYNNLCYAKDIDITFSHNSLFAPSLHRLLYILQDAYDLNRSLQSVEKNDILAIKGYEASNFTTDHNGSTKLTIYFNFDRDPSRPVEPFTFNLLQINVTDKEANGTTRHSDGKISFYYGRLKSDDLFTHKLEDTLTLPVLVYHWGEPMILEGWGAMDLHQNQDGTILKLMPKKGFALTDLDAAMSAKATLQQGFGYYKVHIRNLSKEPRAFIHLEIPQWLWFTYDPTKSYSFDPSSDCTTHPCIQYRYFAKHYTTPVQSGTIEGVHFEQNISATKHGVRIFR